jgi:predicted DNA-binding transcriptional regulator AlpA
VTQQASTRRSTHKRKVPPRRAPMHFAAPDDVGDEQAKSRMIFKPEVIARVGHTYPTLWKWMRDGTFPLSFDVGGKTAWRESEIDHWLASRPRSSLKRGKG